MCQHGRDDEKLKDTSEKMKPPDRFISNREETGQVDKVGGWRCASPCSGKYMYPAENMCNSSVL